MHTDVANDNRFPAGQHSAADELTGADAAPPSGKPAAARERSCEWVEGGLGI